MEWTPWCVCAFLSIVSYLYRLVLAEAKPMRDSAAVLHSKMEKHKHPIFLSNALAIVLGADLYSVVGKSIENRRNLGV